MCESRRMFHETSECSSIQLDWMRALRKQTAKNKLELNEIPIFTKNFDNKTSALSLCAVWKSMDEKMTLNTEHCVEWFHYKFDNGFVLILLYSRVLSANSRTLPQRVRKTIEHQCKIANLASMMYTHIFFIGNAICWHSSRLVWHACFFRFGHQPFRWNDRCGLLNFSATEFHCPFFLNISFRMFSFAFLLHRLFVLSVVICGYFFFTDSSRASEWITSETHQIDSLEFHICANTFLAIDYEIWICVCARALWNSIIRLIISLSVCPNKSKWQWRCSFACKHLKEHQSTHFKFSAALLFIFNHHFTHIGLFTQACIKNGRLRLNG